MHKFAAHQPRVGIECKFHLTNGPAIIGVFNHGGVYGKWNIVESATGKKHEDMDNIESWEYLTSKDK